MRPATGSGYADRNAHDANLIQQGRLAELLAGYLDDVRTLVRCRGVRPDAVDDVVQEVFLRLHRRLRSGAPLSAPFGAVVRRAVQFAATDHADRSGRMRLLDDGVPDGHPAPDDPIDDLVGRIAIEQHIAAMPPAVAEVMRMRWIEGCEIADIAHRLGRSRNAVDQALHRGRAELRRRLADGRG